MNIYIFLHSAAFAEFLAFAWFFTKCCFSLLFVFIQLPLLSFRLTQYSLGRIRPYTKFLLCFIAIFSYHCCILAYLVFVRMYPTIHKFLTCFYLCSAGFAVFSAYSVFVRTYPTMHQVFQHVLYLLFSCRCCILAYSVFWWNLSDHAPSFLACLLFVQLPLLIFGFYFLPVIAAVSIRLVFV